MPGFERTLEQPLAAAIAVPPEARLILTEGNYLLLDEGAGRGSAPRWTEVWYVDLPDDVRRGRDWSTGTSSSARHRTAAREWVDRSDEANAALVRAAAVLSRPRRQPLSTPKGDPEAVRNQALRSVTLHPTWQSTVWSSAWCFSEGLRHAPPS